MVAVNELAVGKGLLAGAVADQIRQLLVAYGLPVAIPAGYDRQLIKDYLLTDKKTIGGRPFFVLPTRIGAAVVTAEVADGLVARVIGVG
jgi:3-dehydroquinate synthase